MEKTGTYKSLLNLFQLYLDSEKTDQDFSALFHKIHHEEEPVDEPKTKPEKPNINLPEFLTGKEVIQMLRISPRTLFNYKQNGTVHCKKVGGKCLYDKAKIEQLLDSNQH